jgi:elongator complex protein 1
VPDDISLAPTDASTLGGTLLTRYTGRTNGTLNTQTTRKTSKNRRREERKRARGRKGSVYEEEYLVNSIGRLIERINTVNEDVMSLVEGLFRRGMREQSRAIEDAMTEVVGLCNAIVDEVFEVKPKQDAEQTEHERPVGADGVLYDALETLKATKVAPIIKSFERLSL